jgi:nucleotide-binding universal stress UspA family protein
MYKRILMPIDGSACSAQAVEHGLNLARSVGAEVTFLYALLNPSSAYGSPEAVPYYALDFYENARSYGEDILLQAQARAEESGVLAEVMLCEWVHPVDAVLKAMADYDLVVMGSHGRSGVRRLLLGSVTEGVMRQSSKPLLVIHCAREEEPQRSEE